LLNGTAPSSAAGAKPSSPIVSLRMRETRNRVLNLTILAAAGNPSAAGSH